ncbi:transposase [Chryseobacterium sp. Marseille-Q8038]
MENLKDIHIGALVYECVNEQDIGMGRICRFLHSTENEILEMYSKKSLDVDILLKWSKLLRYDFFRLYSNHLILYAPIANQNKNGVKSKLPSIPEKFIYKGNYRLYIGALEK